MKLPSTLMILFKYTCTVQLLKSQMNCLSLISGYWLYSLVEIPKFVQLFFHKLPQIENVGTGNSLNDTRCQSIYGKYKVYPIRYGFKIFRSIIQP